MSKSTRQHTKKYVEIKSKLELCNRDQVQALWECVVANCGKEGTVVSSMKLHPENKEVKSLFWNALKANRVPAHQIHKIMNVEVM